MLFLILQTSYRLEFYHSDGSLEEFLGKIGSVFSFLEEQCIVKNVEMDIMLNSAKSKKFSEINKQRVWEQVFEMQFGIELYD